MKHTSRIGSCAWIVGALLHATPTAAQTVHVVPTTQFDIQPTIDGAAPGDIVQLSGGFHSAFRLDKGMTVRGPGTIAGGPYPAVGTTTLDLPPGQEARLIDLRFVQTYSPYFTAGGDVVAHGGRITISDCRFSDGRIESVAADASLSIIRCTLNADNAAPALTVQAGNVAVSASTLRGADWRGTLSFYPLGPSTAIDVAGGSLSLSHCNISGGLGTSSYNQGGYGTPLAPGAALQASAGTVWITDSTLTGGSQPSPFPATAAILSSGSASIHVARSQLVGGTGTPSAPATVGTVTMANALLGADPLPTFVSHTTGASNSYAYTGPAAQPVALLFSISSERAAATAAFLRQPLFAPLDGLVPFGAGVFDANGRLPRSLTAPNDPGLVGQTFWFHAVSGSAFPLELAPAFPTTIE